MTKTDVFNAFNEIFLNNIHLKEIIFGSQIIPNDFGNTIISISSIDHIDLMIEIETHLSKEIPEDAILPGLSINEIVERISEADENSHTFI